MNPVMRKPVFRVSEQIRHKPGCTDTEDRKRFEILDLEKKRDCTICIEKTKALISCAFTAQLIWAFVFSCAKIRFSHDAVKFYFCNTKMQYD